MTMLQVFQLIVVVIMAAFALVGVVGYVKNKDE